VPICGYQLPYSLFVGIPGRICEHNCVKSHTLPTNGCVLAERVDGREQSKR